MWKDDACTPRLGRKVIFQAAGQNPSGRGMDSGKILPAMRMLLLRCEYALKTSPEHLSAFGRFQKMEGNIFPLCNVFPLKEMTKAFFML